MVGGRRQGEFGVGIGRGKDGKGWEAGEKGRGWGNNRREVGE